jgi:hypothetical protein
MNQLGDIILGLGLGLTIAALIANNWRSEPRVKGFSASDAERLTMPAHEIVARQLAVAAGAPEFMWRRYTPQAVLKLLQENPFP